ncbi:RidA family protein [Shumkonia mesophila]|uniref:RidA family protein n=1 Tax=Shumkonia mesophila TaxID=2838854 RepID=UPI002934C256|nr:RidA family protein [Shumkonia mesophila]
MAIEKMGLRTYGVGHKPHASFVKAGRWVFANGIRALDEHGVVHPSVLREDRPLNAPPRAEREARFIFDILGDGFAAANSSLANVVRVDQYYPDWRTVDPYHSVRRQALGKVVAPSTSIIVDGLMNQDALVEVQALAFTKESNIKAEPLAPKKVGGPAESGYAPCLLVDDLVFVAGQLARDDSGDIAPQARVPDTQFWRGTRIRLETRYMVEHRLKPALEAAGSSLDLILKAQVYLSHPEDFPMFMQVWCDAFESAVPPTTVVPVRHPALGTKEATIEINVIAASTRAKARVQDVKCDVPLISNRMLPARRLDDLLFVAGLMAVDEGGLVPEARPEPTAPYYKSGIELQTADILRKAEKIFAAAGTDLANVARAIHFHADLGDFAGACNAWRQVIGNDALPYSAVKVNESMFVPGAKLILDLWGHLPS